ncbi:MAG: transporter related protein [Frankiales bacterium]|nr:transporter related protein [Frankiales bacterium]
MIRLEGVGKRYVQRSDVPSLLGRTREALGTATKKDFWALRGVDLTVEPGERVGVVGSNGSGKTTLLTLLAGVTAPTEGRVLVQGRVSPLIAVGVGFDAELTGRENVRINATVLGLSGSQVDARFDAIVDFSGVEDFLDVPVKFYSSGMLVRLGFSVATAVDPDVLLVDEVLGVGDVAFQAKCDQRMAEVAAQGTTVVVVSHNLAAIRDLCPRSLLVSRGAVLLDGPTPAVLDRYLDVLSGFDDAEDTMPVGPGWSVTAATAPSGGTVDLDVAATVPVEGDAMTLWVGVLDGNGAQVYSETIDVGSATGPSGVRCRVRLDLPLSAGRYVVHGALRAGRGGARLLRFVPLDLTVTGPPARALAVLPSQVNS